jgi:hypothetical protein
LYEPLIWLVTTNDARLALRNGSLLWPSVRQRERGAYRELVVLLAGEIFRRERGAPPPTEDALIGTYLQSLPDDGSAELADGTVGDFALVHEPTTALSASVRRHRSNLVRNIRRALKWQSICLTTAPWNRSARGPDNAEGR